MTRAAKGPVIHGGNTTRALMVQVVIALSPVCAAAVWRHGLDAALLLAISTATAVVFDAALDRRNIGDGSALIIGLLCGLLLPIGAPTWLAAATGLFAVGLGKHTFGGVGNNLFNPAALGLVLAAALAPGYFFTPRWQVDLMTFATPLAAELGAQPPDLVDLVSGANTVTLGGSMPAAIVVGGILLIAMRTIDWRMPLVYLATISAFALVLSAGARMSGHAPWLEGNPLVQLVGGGALLTAFFLVTDPVTAPFSRRGRLVFCVVAATCCVFIRYFTAYPDGAALGILMANALVPVIDRITLGSPRRLDVPSESSPG